MIRTWQSRALNSSAPWVTLAPVIGYRKDGRPIHAILGGVDDPANPVPQPAPPVPPAPPAPPADQGFPAGTSLEQMTLDQQVAYWKHHSRKHEDTAKARADYDDLKAKAAQFDQLNAASRTDQEKAIDEAKTAAAKDAREAAIRELTGPLVDEHIKARVGDRLTAEQLSTLLNGLDRTKFVDAEGRVDTAKVTAYVSAISPATGKQPPKPLGPPASGQGQRPSGVTPSVSAGSDLYDRLHPKKTA